VNDELARRRRKLPWAPVEKDYSFATLAAPDFGQNPEREVALGTCVFSGELGAPPAPPAATRR
jgi:hypothetical protein